MLSIQEACAILCQTVNSWCCFAVRDPSTISTDFAISQDIHKNEKDDGFIGLSACRNGHI